MVLSKIKKRNGSVVKFEPQKITKAISKAMTAVKKRDDKLTEKLSKEVNQELEKIFKRKTPTVEDIQNMVEEILIREDLTNIAKAYIIYRQKHKEIRETKKFFGIKDRLKLTLNATRVLERRYLLKDENGKVTETPGEMFQRVAKTVAKAEKKGKAKYEKEFYKILSNLEFLPNSPTLMNAGTKLGMLSACFVIPVEDSLKSIFEAVKNTAIIQQAGGGTGFTFTHLRPKGDMVQSTKGIASGPVSFIKIFDTTTDVIKQGSKRRGANMGILNIDHPDVVEFITSKSREGAFTNFNFSVGITDNFMKAVKKNKDYSLVNPRTGKEVGKLNAAELFNMITMYAWKTGDPGLIFLDTINKKNPLLKMGKIEATNPCGEIPMYNYESCNLGSINLAKFVKNKKIDWTKLKEAVKTAVRFLDDVIDINKYPMKEIEKITEANRRIGLGVMGFAEMLIQLKIPYDSKDAVKTAEKIMKFVNSEAIKVSEKLAEEKKEFPNFKKSDYKKKRRNLTLTTIAPTGTISIIAGCSSGIEPLFAVVFVRNVMGGTKLIEINPYFEKIAKEKGFYSEELMSRIARTGSIQKLENVPDDIKKIFKTALDIEPEWHVKIQAAFQKHTENAVSKTINFPHEATVEEVKKAYLLAYKLGCKGTTIYRYGSKKEQVLYLGTVIGKEEGETLEYVSAESEYSGGCPNPFCPH
ncbi:MAG: adenosylcobalamin-dependent ribonucleoside-diphosphate reductase [Nanoarchaeota archaeon]|nr:adenosylcobalamin-dependent ribonucleoside-diphosphate reductase [Nanoarchaeota archaeon]